MLVRRWPIERQVLAGFGLAFLLLLGIDVAAYRATQSFIEQNTQVTHTQDVLAELATTQSLLTDAETGQRGYVITGDDSYLEPYEASVADIEQRLDRLRSLTADNPSQQQRLTTLDTQVAAKFMELQASIDLRRSQGFEAARQLVATDEGKGRMDAIRVTIADLESAERRLLDDRTLAAERDAQNSLVAFGAVTLLGLVLLGIVYWSVTRDLAARGRAEARIARINAGLEQTVLERTAELAAEVVERTTLMESISHDLNNPLAAVRGIVEVLQLRLARAEVRDAGWLAEGLGRISAGADRMLSLIGELLDLARLQAGQPLSLDREPTDLVTMVQHWLAGPASQPTQHTLRVELPPAGTTLTILADRVRLERVLENLLSNALKFSPQAIEIVVRVAATQTPDGQPEGTIELHDHGVGIPIADLPRVFERFHRGANVSGRIAGTGLGLAGAQRIVSEHGGRLELVSVEGEGTTAIVRLPLLTGASAVEMTAAE